EQVRELGMSGHDAKAKQSGVDNMNRRNILLGGTSLVAASVLINMVPVCIAQAQTVSEQETYGIAREAYVYAYPIITMDVSLRQWTNVPSANTVPLREPVNQFADARAYPRAEERDVVRYNFDPLYSPVWLDLSREPIVLSVPDTGRRYYLLPMLDMWTDVF